MDKLKGKLLTSAQMSSSGLKVIDQKSGLPKADLSKSPNTLNARKSIKIENLQPLSKMGSFVSSGEEEKKNISDIDIKIKQKIQQNIMQKKG